MRYRWLVVFLCVILGSGAVTHVAGQQPSSDVGTPGTPVISLGADAEGIASRSLARVQIDTLPPAPGRFAAERLTVAAGESSEVVAPSAGLLLLYVESGEPTIIDELGLEATPGTGAYQLLPSDVPFTARNDTDEPMSLLTVTLAPADAAVSTEAAPVGSPERAVTVDMSEFAFEPSEITIQGGTDVEVTLTNSGTVLHDFTIEALDIAEDVEPGASTTITINAPAGEYDVICSEPGHEQSGMDGTLHVIGAEPTPTPLLVASPAVPAAGVLFETAVTALPDPPAILFLEQLTLDPGAELPALSGVGPMGIFAVEGDLTIERPERLPGRLPIGKGVAFPTGDGIRVRNSGAETAVALIAGVVGAEQAFNSEPSSVGRTVATPSLRPGPPPPPTATVEMESPAPTATTADAATAGKPVVVSGTGTMVSDTFWLDGGRYKVSVRLEISGFSGFIAVIHGDQNSEQLLFNELIEETGTWTASTILDVEVGGSFFVEVSNTDAPWSLRFERF